MRSTGPITIEWNLIFNCPKSGKSISKEDIEKDGVPKSHRYRNRHQGDFLKGLDLTGGHSIGFQFYFAIGLQRKESERTSPLWAGGYPPFFINPNRQNKSYMVYDAALLLFSKISALHHHHICSGLGNCRSYDKPQQLYQYI